MVVEEESKVFEEFNFKKCVVEEVVDGFVSDEMWVFKRVKNEEGNLEDIFMLGVFEVKKEKLI